MFKVSKNDENNNINGTPTTTPTTANRTDNSGHSHNNNVSWASRRKNCKTEEALLLANPFLCPNQIFLACVILSSILFWVDDDKKSTKNKNRDINKKRKGSMKVKIGQ